MSTWPKSAQQLPTPTTPRARKPLFCWLFLGASLSEQYSLSEPYLFLCDGLVLLSKMTSRSYMLHHVVQFLSSLCVYVCFIYVYIYTCTYRCMLGGGTSGQHQCFLYHSQKRPLNEPRARWLGKYNQLATRDPPVSAFPALRPQLDTAPSLFDVGARDLNSVRSLGMCGKHFTDWQLPNPNFFYKAK